MATINHNLSEYDKDTMPNASNMRIGIVVSEWNSDITDNLLNGAVNTLISNGVKEENISVSHVPGAFELTFGAKTIAERGNVDAVIGLGCIIRGETPHFDFIAQGVAQGFTQLNIKYCIPFIFGVLTDNNKEQSVARSGGELGNKGDEAAVTAIKMADFACKNKK